jgi:phage baseplate assembly protein W|tara:strand:- start:167 stop:568 length:402 start_codon:yes stop_codon:yes gene_type:complete
MPVERISKGFKDISMSFEVNPINSDLIGVKNDTAISRSIRNLVLTTPGERFFNEDLGSGVSQLLFDTVDDISAAVIRDEVEQTIIRFEPRVKLQDVAVKPNYDNNEFDVTVSYDVIGIDALPQQLNFALQPTR